MGSTKMTLYVQAQGSESEASRDVQQHHVMHSPAGCCLMTSERWIQLVTLQMCVASVGVWRGIVGRATKMTHTPLSSK